MKTTRTNLATILLLALVPAGVNAQTSRREPHTFLKTHIGLTDAEILDMERGKVVTKVLETDVKTEVAVFGVIRMEAPIDYFVTWQKDIEKFEGGDAVQAIQKIGSPPRIEDFAKMAFPEDDLDALRKCRVGKCDVKVDEANLLRLQKEVNWSAPDAPDQANRLIRQLMLESVETYQEGGDEALGAYRDKKRPTFQDKEVAGLLKSSPYLIEYIPEFHEYLKDFPKTKLPGSEDFLYWSKVQFGLKPTVRMSHVVIYPLDESEDAEVVIGSKMLYASHYFHVALELKFLVRDTARPDDDGFYLISVNRSRSDGLTGLFGGIVRSSAQSEARKGLAFALETGKRLLEEGYRQREQ